MQKLELLAPARDLACGMAAIDHGADAVYIGASRFGARAAAGNSVDDIRSLCCYAHQFGARVYVTVNTIVYDHELQDTSRLLTQLADAGADALLVQDMGVAQLCQQLPAPPALHASTQTDNRTADKVRWLLCQGFSRAVLARELSVDEIAHIHEQVPQMELEVFVHGALCVSYSGLCYASQYCFGRSANRGECAQFCRMKFNLLDADDHLIERDRYLLSLKDLCLIDHLEELAAAGATSFKIEGRLKDIGYVKNVVAAYSQRLDQLVERHPALYCRASQGSVRLTFQPDPNKTFNRGYTTYFLHGRKPHIASFSTPKAIGEYVGCVKEVRAGSFTVAGTSRFANGDGLCFINRNQQLEGFRVNRVENNRIFPHRMPSSLRAGMRLYRNNDQQFERLLSKPTATRKLPVAISIRAEADGYSIVFNGVESHFACQHQLAQTPQHDNIRRQLSKLGGTPFECTEVSIPSDFPFFIPSSELAQMRRVAMANATSSRLSPQSPVAPQPSVPQPLPRYREPYLYNIANAQARTFYEQQGLQHAAPAPELQEPRRALLMQCRHCLRFALGHCVKHGGQQPQWREPLRLQLGDGRCFTLEFDCSHCQMNVYADPS